MTLLLVIAACTTAKADTTWVNEPGNVTAKMGYYWRSQDDALRRSTTGNLYTSLFNMNFDYRIAYADAAVGIVDGLQGSIHATYLWAREIVDSTSEDPSRIYDGLSDMWIGARYQFQADDWPLAVGATVRVPWLYAHEGTENGQILTEVPGLLKYDYELSGHLSHVYSIYACTALSAAFRLREGAPAHQVVFKLDNGFCLPLFSGMSPFTIHAGLDAQICVGEPGRSTSRDRFSGLTTERGTNQFDFNNTSFVRPFFSFAVPVMKELEISTGYAWVAWGKSAIVWRDAYVQLQYKFWQ